ncbi:YdgA family protein [Leeia sp.]|uniref:YdgA family protein n=1 Tax=Leeia sp. TaxID=2884678 RepID=UPI0035AE3EE8
MSKKIVLPVAIVAVLGVGYTGTSWWFGKQAQTQHQHFVERLSKVAPYLKVTELESSSGIFSSSRTIKYTVAGSVGCDLAESMQRVGKDMGPLEFTVKETIHHGPFTFGGGHTGFARAVVNTELVLSADTRKKLEEVFGKVPPASLRTVVSMGGDSELTLDVPELTSSLKDGSKLQWTGLTASVSYPADYSSYVTKMSSNGLTITGASGEQVQIGKISMDSNSKTEFDVLSVGDASFNIDSMSFKNAALPMLNTEVSKISYTATSKKNGDFLDMSLKLGVDKVNTMGKSYGPAHYDVSLNHLHGSTLGKLVQEVNSMSGQCSDQATRQMQLMSALGKHGIALMQQTPEFILDRISLNMPEGEAVIKANAKINNFAASDVQQPAGLLQKLEAGLDINFPEAIAKMLAAQMMAKEGMDPATAEAMLTQQLEGALAQGLLARNGKQLVTKLSWKAGKLQINGKEFPLPMLGALMGGAPAAPEGGMPEGDMPEGEASDAMPQ